MTPLSTVALLSVVLNLTPDQVYDEAKAKAEVVSSIGNFIDRFIGECEPRTAAGRECEQRVAKERAALIGKTFVARIDELPRWQIQLLKSDESAGTAILGVTPIFPGSNWAITHGTPKQLDSKGNPILQIIPINGTIPEGMSATSLRRHLESQGVRMEFIFIPEGIWKIPRRGHEDVRGVKARIIGIAINTARTGDGIAVWNGN